MGGCKGIIQRYVVVKCTNFIFHITKPNTFFLFCFSRDWSLLRLKDSPHKVREEKISPKNKSFCSNRAMKITQRFQDLVQNISLRFQLRERRRNCKSPERFLAQEQYEQDAVMFWRTDGEARLKYPALYLVAQHVFLVPASSAPVERVFSKGEIILRQHGAKLSPSVLETLMLLKCNEHI